MALLAFGVMAYLAREPNTMKLKLLMMLFFSLVLNACSTQAWYDGVRQGGEQSCRMQPPGAAEDCLARLNQQSYEAYEKARQGK